VHGILAGPRLFAERGDVAYTFMVGLLSTVVAMLIFGLVTIRWSSLMVHVPARFMVSAVLALSAIGTYGLRNSLVDVYVLIALGVIGYLFTKLDIPLVTIALGLVLGNLTEQSFQQAVMVSMVDTGTAWLIFLKRPVAAVLMLAALVVLGSGILQASGEGSADQPAETGSTPAPRKRRWLTLRAANVLLSLALIALSAYGLMAAGEFSPRGALLPRVLCVALIVLAGILLVVNVNPKTGAPGGRLFPFSEIPWPLWTGVVAAFVLLGLAADRFGFYESTFVFLAVTTWMMSAGEKTPRSRWLIPLAFAAGFDALLFVVFRLILEIPTPPGVLL
jgi:putative tricarboxylic transport membrane protein